MPKQIKFIFLTLSCITVIHHFKALYACLGVARSTHLIKLNQIIAPMDLYPYAKSASIPHLFEMLFKETSHVLAQP